MSVVFFSVIDFFLFSIPHLFFTSMKILVFVVYTHDVPVLIIRSDLEIFRFIFSFPPVVICSFLVHGHNMKPR